MTADLQSLIKTGIAHERQGRLAEAGAAFAAVLAIDPRHFGALVMLGMIAARQQDFPAAVEALTRAVAVQPESVEAHGNLGNALLALGRPAEALASYETAAALAPGQPLLRYNMGNALWRLGRLDAALAAYDDVLRQKPEFPQAHNNRGMVLKELRRLPEALTALQTASRLNPGHANTHNNIGNLLQALDRTVEAVQAYDLAIAREPANAVFLQNRGVALLDLRRMDEAAQSFEAALANRPETDFLLGNVVYARLKACNWDDLDQWFARLEQAVLAGARAINPFSLLTMLDRPALHRRAADIYAEAACPPPAEPPSTAAGSGGKIRLGYFSADFHDHATAHLAAGLFEAHDRDRFEVYGFSFGPDLQDAMRRRLVAAFDGFVDLRGKTDAASAAQARAMGIDIAIDLKGHTQNSRPGIFARRCAPVQANWLGYPGTLGSIEGRVLCDYIIADRIVLPPERAGDYAEAVVHLPQCYQVNDLRRPAADRSVTRAALGLPPDAFVYCCFNNNHKILPALFDSWMRILAAVDGSVLWLLEDNPVAAANLRREAARRGIAPERLVFAPRLRPAAHIARHACADLFLDTLPYNAHTTASDALWAGLPVLTCMGQSFASRVAASLLTTFGLPELIATDAADYEAKAIAFARAPERLQVLRRHIVETGLTNPLFDTARFTRQIEAAYAAMHARRLAGLPPEMIVV